MKPKLTIANKFLAYGILVCILLLGTCVKQWSVTSMFSSGKWGPKGHNSYHK